MKSLSEKSISSFQRRMRRGRRNKNDGDVASTSVGEERKWMTSLRVRVHRPLARTRTIFSLKLVLSLKALIGRYEEGRINDRVRRRREGDGRYLAIEPLGNIGVLLEDAAMAVSVLGSCSGRLNI